MTKIKLHGEYRSLKDSIKENVKQENWLEAKRLIKKAQIAYSVLNLPISLLLMYGIYSLLADKWETVIDFKNQSQKIIDDIDIDNTGSALRLKDKSGKTFILKMRRIRRIEAGDHYLNLTYNLDHEENTLVFKK